MPNVYLKVKTALTKFKKKIGIMDFLSNMASANAKTCGALDLLLVLDQ